MDRRRIKQDLGTSFAGLLGSLALARLVKSMGFSISDQVIHVKFDKVIEPAFVAYRPEDRFKAMKR